MSRIRKLAVAGLTFGVALGIGFVMQNGDVLAARFGEVPGRGPTLAQAGPVQAAPIQTAPVRVALETTPDLGPIPRPEARPAAASGCGVALAAQSLPAGLVNLTLESPCAAGAPVTIHHGGMMFSDRTDGAGHLRVTVPALSAPAVFIAEIGTTSAVAVAEVAGLDRLDRAVLQWQDSGLGDGGLGLQALEFGARAGEPGHVWRGAPRDPAAALEGAGGFILDLGVPAGPGALLAQVYTLPRDRMARTGEVALSIAAAVTPATCGRTLAAQVIQIGPGQAPVARDLSITLPGCERTGDTVVIDGLLAPLHLAAQPG